MVHLAELDGGRLGIPSLRVQYHQLNLASFANSLNGKGTALGLVTRSLLRHQLKAWQGLRAIEVPSEARYFRLCKQLAMAQDTNVHLSKAIEYVPSISSLFSVDHK
jgi:hypothetical protein